MHWNVDAGRYRCGAIEQPEVNLRRWLPVVLHRFAGPLAPALVALAKRAIAVELGCDSSLEANYPSQAGCRD